MPGITAAILELTVAACALWGMLFLLTLVHELGHAVGCRLATGDRRWHIRVGWGRRLLYTKRLTVNLLVFDGLFTHAEETLDTKAKRIAMLLGGPVFSLLTAAGLAVLRFGRLSFRSDFLADGVIEFLLNTALAIDPVILVLSAAPVRYFHGEIRGPETDGLQIIRAVRRRGS